MQRGLVEKRYIGSIDDVINDHTDMEVYSMADHVQQTIGMLKGQIDEAEGQVNEKKKMVNGLLKTLGLPSFYSDADSVSKGGQSFRRDQFYTKPLATAVREILEAREGAGLGAATIDEIYQTLVDGGYKFANKRDRINKRTLTISLAKNSTTFHKLPNGDFGLLAWYPGAKESPGKNGGGDKVIKERELEEAEAKAAEAEVAIDSEGAAAEPITPK